jgi:AcrR family transcriptional regulator
VLAHSPSRAETKRPHIERAALRLFVTRGLRGTTIREIAAEAGVAEGTLYRHWRSKRDLARALFRGCAATVAAAVRRAAEGERLPRARLAAAIGALFRAARDETLLY